MLSVPRAIAGKSGGKQKGDPRGSPFASTGSAGQSKHLLIARTTQREANQTQAQQRKGFRRRNDIVDAGLGDQAAETRGVGFASGATGQTVGRAGFGGVDGERAIAIRDDRGAFTREELWCVIRDLHASRDVTIMLVTHDLREAVFLADRIFVMSARPGRVIAEHRIDFGRPRELSVMYEPAFNEKVQELRGQIAEARVAA